MVRTTGMPGNDQVLHIRVAGSCHLARNDSLACLAIALMLGRKHTSLQSVLNLFILSYPLCCIPCPTAHDFSLNPNPRCSSHNSQRHNAREAAGRRVGAGRSSPGSPSCGESRPPRYAGQARRGRRHFHAQPSPWALAVDPHRDSKRRGRAAQSRATAFRCQPERHIRAAPRARGPPTSSLTSAKPHRASTALLHPLPQLPGCHLTLQPPPAGRGGTLRPMSRQRLRQCGRSLTRGRD